ncbi:hypothetical protein BS17DRAFT_797445 [Gyrodon lividus]|nr:hypothetical protein BS17DRAFT_797445 [Gyrodon lividus]
MKVSQLVLLDHFAEHCPRLFCKKFRISDHIVFSSGTSQNCQLPIVIQLAIFLNHAGHYGNAISPEDVAQWAGVSVGSVINCTNHVMVSILDQHDDFVIFPSLDSQDMENARSYRNGTLAADGSAFCLYAKPGLHGETSFDQKSYYSLNYQVRNYRCSKYYGLGLPDSVYDAYAFQLTWTARDHEELLGEGHWIWADSAYPSETWCVMPFKKPKNGCLT